MDLETKRPCEENVKPYKMSGKVNGLADCHPAVGECICHCKRNSCTGLWPIMMLIIILRPERPSSPTTHPSIPTFRRLISFLTMLAQVKLQQIQLCFAPIFNEPHMRV